MINKYNSVKDLEEEISAVLNKVSNAEKHIGVIEDQHKVHEDTT